MRTTVSEADGKYSIASLPSGPYELTFELSGFQAFKRGNIILGLGQILTIDGQLQVASLQESVTVTGASPVVDMQIVEGRHRLHDRQAGRRADGDRRLGRPRPGVGRPDERLRRRRQPQEPADAATRASASATRTAS